MSFVAKIDRPGGLIGPNAVLQLTAALDAAGLAQMKAELFGAAQVTGWLESPPEAMINERAAGRLHQAVRRALPPEQARAVMADAGRRTGDYLLSHRIPRLVGILLPQLPSSMAARLLAKAITAHAWTFAGSGTFTAATGNTTVFELIGNPFCAGERAVSPVCVWHTEVFLRLFQALVSPTARARETACEACGDACCRFTLDL